MINRELIRLKVVQIVYEHSLNNGSNIDSMQQELAFSLQKSYDLYRYMLLLLVDLRRVAERQVEAGIQRWNRIHDGAEPSRRLIDNPFILSLDDNEQLRAFRENDKWTWMDQEQFLLRTYQHIVTTDYYNRYMEMSEPSWRDHREVWYQIYLDCACNSEFIDSLLEDRSLYWNDDKFLVDSFVLKTISRYDKDGAIKPDFKDDGDRLFAEELLTSAIRGAETYKATIAAHLQPGWDMERIASMDSVIMQVALAEIVNFADIPLRVSINEYIEIAKTYSTPHSGSYVNGMLDAMSRTLAKQGLITKEIKDKKHQETK